MIALTIGGVGCLLAAIPQWHALPTIGASFLILAAAAALMSASTSRRDLAALVDQLRQRVTGTCLRPLSAPSKDVLPLVLAANDLVDQAEKTVNDALLKAKELEIQ